MDTNRLPGWLNALPTLIGVVLTIIAIYALPRFGIRNTWGPIVGLPTGLIVGVAILSSIAKHKE